jgi:hypothetical protein
MKEMETPPPTAGKQMLPDNPYLQPDAKRRKSSVGSLTLSDLDISLQNSLGSTPPRCQNYIDGKKSIFRHDTQSGTHNTCRWKKQETEAFGGSDVFCCELRNKVPSENDFMHIMVRLYLFRSVIPLPSDSQHYFNQMVFYYRQVYDIDTMENRNIIYLYNCTSKSLHDAARMAIHMNWQNLSMRTWSNKSIVYVVSNAKNGIINFRPVVARSTQTNDASGYQERSLYKLKKDTSEYNKRNKSTQVDIPPSENPDTQGGTDDSEDEIHSVPLFQHETHEYKIEQQLRQQRSRENYKSSLIEQRKADIGIFLTAVQSPYMTIIETHSMHYLDHVLFKGFGNVHIKCESNFVNVGANYGNLSEALRIVPNVLSNAQTYQFERCYRYHETSQHNMMPYNNQVRISLMVVAQYMVANMLNARVEILGLTMFDDVLDQFLDDLLADLPPINTSYRLSGAIARPNHYFQMVSGHNCVILSSYPFLRIHTSHRFDDLL